MALRNVCLTSICFKVNTNNERILILEESTLNKLNKEYKIHICSWWTETFWSLIFLSFNQQKLNRICLLFLPDFYQVLLRKTVYFIINSNWDMSWLSCTL